MGSVAFRRVITASLTAAMLLAQVPADLLPGLISAEASAAPIADEEQSQVDATKWLDLPVNGQQAAQTMVVGISGMVARFEAPVWCPDDSTFVMAAYHNNGSSPGGNHINSVGAVGSVVKGTPESWWGYDLNIANSFSHVNAGDAISMQAKVNSGGTCKWYQGPAGDTYNKGAAFVRSSGTSSWVQVTSFGDLPFRIFIEPDSAQPNLQVASFTASSSVQAGGTASYSWNVRNSGGGTATSSPLWTDQVWLCPTATYSTSCAGAGGIIAPSALNAGTSYDRTFSATINASTVPGNYYFLLQTDSNSQVAESHETDNFSTAVPVTVTTAATKITGTVTGPDQFGVANVLVRIHDAAGGALETSGATSSLGQYSLAVAGGKTYNVIFTPPEGSGLAVQVYNGQFSTATATGVPVSVGTTVAGIDARLVTGYPVTGFVRNASGQALSGVQVSAYLGTSGVCCYFIRSDTTNADGSYLLELASERQYKIRFAPNTPDEQWWNGKNNPGNNVFNGWTAADVLTVSTPGGNSGVNATLGPPPSVDLGVTTTDSADPVVVGGVFDSTSTVTNHSTVTATSVSLTVAVPAGLQIVGGSPSTMTCSFATTGQSVLCTRQSLGAGASTSITVQVRADVAGVHDIVATVTSAESDSNTVNNTARESTTVRQLGPAIVSARVTVSGNGAADRADAGDEIALTFDKAIDGTLADNVVRATDADGGSYAIACTGTLTTGNGLVDAACTWDAPRLVLTMRMLGDSALESAATHGTVAGLQWPGTIVATTGITDATGSAVDLARSTDLLIDLIDIPTVTISAEVREDLDRDGTFDAGEPFLTAPRLEVFRIGADGSRTSVGAAVNSPNISVSGISGGTFDIVETDPTGYVSTSPNTVRVVVTSGTSSTVFLDARACTAELRSGTTLLATAPVAADGSYSFPGALPGTYTVVILCSGTSMTTAQYLVPVEGAPTTSPPVPCVNTSRSLSPTAPLLTHPTVTTFRLCEQGQGFWSQMQVQPGGTLQVRLTGPGGGPLPYDVDLYVFNDPKKAPTGKNLPELSVQFAGEQGIGEQGIGEQGIGEQGIGEQGIGEQGIGEQGIGEQGIGEQGIGEQGIGEQGIGEQGIGEQGIGEQGIGEQGIGEQGIGEQGIGHLLLRMSARKGTAREGLQISTGELSGPVYVLARGRLGRFDPARPLELSAKFFPGPCSGLAFGGTSTLAVPTGGTYRTLILTDLTQFGAAGPGVAKQLTALAGHSKVLAHVADLAGDEQFRAARAQWQSNIGCALAPNALVAVARDYVARFKLAHPELRFVQLVGDDAVMPARRGYDRASIARECQYGLAAQGALAASLRGCFYLEEGAYTGFHPFTLGERTVYLPELPVSRLVGGLPEITKMIQTFITNNGVIRPQRAMVTGINFLSDLAAQQATRLAGVPRGTGTLPVNAATTANPIIQTLNGLPSDAAAWRRSDLADALGAIRPDAIFMNAHVTDPDKILAANYEVFSTTDWQALLDSGGNYLDNGIGFFTSCHSAANVGAYAVPNVTPSPELGFFAARNGMTLVANRNFQYGDDEGIGWSERIQARVLDRLLAGGVSLGEAVAEVVRGYPRELKELTGTHEKTLAVVINGIGNVEVDLTTPGATFLTEQPRFSTAAPVPVSGDRNAGVDLRTHDLAVDFTSATNQLEQRTVPLKDFSTGATVNTTYWTVVTPASGSSGYTQRNPGEPVRPLLPIPMPARSGTDTTMVRGAVPQSVSYISQSCVPFEAEASFQLAEPHRRFYAANWFPSQIDGLRYLPGAPGDETAFIVPYRYRSDRDATTGALLQSGTCQTFSAVTMRYYFSSALGATGTAAGPTLLGVNAIVRGTSVDYEIRAAAPASVGVQDVFVAWYDASKASGQIVTLPLVPHASDATLWTRSEPLGTVAAADIRFVVYAVSGAGQVTYSSNFGAEYTAAAPRTEIKPNAATTLTFATGQQTSFVAMQGGTVSGRLVRAGTTTGIAGRHIVIGLASERVSAYTDASGSFSAEIDARAPAGPQVLVVTLEQDDAAALFGTTASLPVTVLAEATGLTLQLAPAAQQYSDLVSAQATLTNSRGRAMRHETVYFLVKDAAGTVRQAAHGETDHLGTARVALRLDVGQGPYTVEAAFGGTIPLPGGPSVEIRSLRYDRSRATARLGVEPETVAAVYSGDTGARALNTAISLAGTITESDATLGDVTRAQARFEIVNTSTGTALPPVAATLTPTGAGTAAVAAVLSAGFSATGVYRVTLVVGGDHYQGAGDPAYIAAVDPGAGSANGGGWIAAAEATRAGFAAGERLQFGFQWKYKAGSTVPEGTLALNQKGFVFQARSADWLVISGDTASAEGSGELNRVAGYRFRMTVRDGTPDTASFTIWDATSSFDAPLYRAENDLGNRGTSIQIKPR